MQQQITNIGPFIGALNKIKIYRNRPIQGIKGPLQLKSKSLKTKVLGNRKALHAHGLGGCCENDP